MREGLLKTTVHKHQLSLSLLQVYHLYKEENPEAEAGTPRSTCLCRYHENTNLLLDCVNKCLRRQAEWTITLRHWWSVQGPQTADYAVLQVDLSEHSTETMGSRMLTGIRRSPLQDTTAWSMSDNQSCVIIRDNLEHGKVVVTYFTGLIEFINEAC